VAVEEKTFEETIRAIKQNCVENNKNIAEQLAQGNKKFAEQGKDLEHLKDWQQRQNGNLAEIATCMQAIKDDVQEIKLEAARGKPSWAVSLALGALLSVITGLAVYLITL